MFDSHFFKQSHTLIHKLAISIRKLRPANSHPEMYRALNNRLRRSTDKAREIWYNKSKCDEIDQNIKEGKSGIAYRLAKEVTGKQKGAKRTQAIMDENGSSYKQT